MSYCRWSSDNSKCDIYAYESDQGFMIHVASSKLIGEPPKADMALVVEGDKDSLNKFIDDYRKHSEWMKTAEYKPIGLPHDGETFTLETIEQFYETMKYLKAIGYHIPEGVIEGIHEEMNESPTPPAQ